MNTSAHAMILINFISTLLQGLSQTGPVHFVSLRALHASSFFSLFLTLS